jgi:hypothetical protein
MIERSKATLILRFPTIMNERAMIRVGIPLVLGGVVLYTRRVWGRSSSAPLGRSFFFFRSKGSIL